MKALKTYSDISISQDMVPCCVMAPVMSWFVLWVIREAVASGKKRLYFLARDGYSMYRVAKIICEKTGIDLECRYLYCSRYAWRGAEYHLLREDSLRFIGLGGIHVTVRKLMARAGLTQEETEETALLLDMTDRLDEALSYGQIQEMKRLLGACPAFMQAMEQHAAQNYPLVCAYLKQEGLLDETPYALVDSGWTGSMQKSLQNLLRSMGCEKAVEGYYFGLYEYPSDMPREAYHCWYFSPDKYIRRKVHFSNSLFECIFSSAEGMTTGYACRDGCYMPLFEKNENPNAAQIQYTTKILEEYTLMLLKLFPDSAALPSRGERRTAQALLSAFMGRPTMREAERFGAYVFCDDVVGEGRQTVAANLTYEEIRQNRFWRKAFSRLRKSGAPVEESAWQEGSVVRCKEAGDLELWHCVWYKYGLYIRKRIVQK